MPQHFPKGLLIFTLSCGFSHGFSHGFPTIWCPPTYNLVHSLIFHYVYDYHKHKREIVVITSYIGPPIVALEQWPSIGICLISPSLSPPPWWWAARWRSWPSLTPSAHRDWANLGRRSRDVMWWLKSFFPVRKMVLHKKKWFYDLHFQKNANTIT